MSKLEVVKLGTSKLDESSRLPGVQATREVTGPDDEETMGTCAVYGTPCVTWLPAAANDEGHCEAIGARDVAGVDFAVLGARDERSKMAGELASGEACVHPTDPSFESRLFLKDKVASLMASPRSALIIDDNEGTATLAIGGAALQIGKNGIMIFDADGNGISIIGGVAHIKASAVALGDSIAMCPVECTPVVPPNTPSTPSPTVLVPDPNAPV